MRLIGAHIRNFKLLRDVHLAFSLSPERPLTVIRAENGNGKTSVLYALMWALYGTAGLPPQAQRMRLIASTTPVGKPVEVQVRVEFAAEDSSGITSRYRLVRTVQQSSTGPNPEDVTQGAHEVALTRVVDGVGEVQIDPALLELFPNRLRPIFFTNGDDVQEFIAGGASGDSRQSQVHAVIQALLGIDGLKKAVADAAAVEKAMRTKKAKAEGADVQQYEERLRRSEEELATLVSRSTELLDGLEAMRAERNAWNKELTALRGKGDLDQVNANISSFEADLVDLQKQRDRALQTLKELMTGEAFSYALMGDKLNQGHDLLSELADRNVIPGVSVQVLSDRLAMGVCICGESLSDADESGAERCQHVLELITEQTRVSEESKMLTGLWHVARQSRATQTAEASSGRSFWDTRQALRAEYLGRLDAIAAKNARLAALREQRRTIDDGRIHDLVQRLDQVSAKISVRDQELGEVKGRLSVLEAARRDAKDQYDAASEAKSKSSRASLEESIARDISAVLGGTLKSLENEYVRRVADATSATFLRIVGGDPEFASSVFTGVEIADNFDIEVQAHESRLDPAFELNGASQRALTVSFIWGLMEVSGTEAPRIIDTPLGMVAGGVKRRLVQAITESNETSSVNSQTVLLLTRSEIRDIEDLLDERAGVEQTLTCSKDFPEDLVYSWDVEHPEVRSCDCGHRDSCRLCARKYDAQHGVTFREQP